MSESHAEAVARWERIKAMRSKGMAWEDIGVAEGISRQRATAIGRGVEPKPPGRPSTVADAKKKRDAALRRAARLRAEGADDSGAMRAAERWHRELVGAGAASPEGGS